MQDFNLRPEIMGFGRPERALATPAPALLPADQWKPSGKDFEVNGLGQLRTVLALPPTQEQCMCDNCVVNRQGRFQPLPSDDPRPLVEQVKTEATIAMQPDTPEWHPNGSPVIKQVPIPKAPDSAIRRALKNLPESHPKYAALKAEYVRRDLGIPF